MEDSVNFSDLNESKMDLLLESDEEEASLLKEMEQQDDVKPARPSSPEDLLQLKSICPDSPEDYEMTEFPEIHEKASGDFVGTLEVNDEKIQRQFIAECPNNTGTVTCKEKKQVDEQQENIEGEAAHQEGFVGCHFNSSTCSGTQQNKILPLTEYTIDDVQILRLDMSASQLLFAKSAAALGSQSCQAKSTNCLSNASQFQGLSFMELTAVERIGNTLSEDDKSSNSKSNEERKETHSNFFMKMQQQDSCVTHLSGNQNNRKPEAKNRKRKNQVCKQKSESVKFNTPVKKKRLPHFNMNGPRVVVFRCSYCDFKCPFTKENIGEIVEHLAPRERFNHLHEISEKLNSFKECVKLNVMVAKNKAKAQVRFLSRAECTNCGQQVPLDVDSSDQLALHYNWCRKLMSDDKYISCPYCNELVHRGSIKKHLNVKSKKRCTMNVASTLQLMSCVCKQYALEHQPVCIVCNEKCWSYLGHRVELNPVCEACRLNIISGNTTKLKNRDLAACAICSYQCSKKCVTYWASELEAVFIGENCIKKLEEPVIHKSIAVANAREAKIKKLIEMAVASNQFSMNVERAQAKNISNSVNCVNESCTSNSDKYSSNFTNTMQDTKKKETAMNYCTKFTQSGPEKSKVKCDLPVPSRVTNGHFIPITGSFRINAGNPLPFAKLAATSDTQSSLKTVPVTSNPALEVNEGKTVIQSDVSKDSSKVEYTGNLQEIAKGTLSMRVSPHQSNLKTICQLISNSTPNNGSTSLPLKYVLKLNSLTTTRQEKKDKKEANANHIIIRTSSNPSQIKGGEVAPPRVAQVIKTAGNLLMKNKNSYIVARKQIVKK